MHKDCEEIVNLVNSSIIPRLGKQAEVEELAFFWKMIGDYYRYASEAASSKSSRDQRLPRYKKGALEAYSKAMDLCVRGLKPYNSVCLGLALNFSVFHYEVMGDPVKACQIAKGSLESAIEVLDECSEANFKEA